MVSSKMTPSASHRKGECSQASSQDSRLSASEGIREGRESSPELGSPSYLQQYDKKTGRPIRRTAGKVKPLPGYVDSGIIEDDESVEVPSEDEEGHFVKQRKRKRTPSPTPPPLDPIIRDDGPDDATDEEDVGVFHYNKPKLSPVTLQFNVPLGFHGPLVVKLDRSLLLDNTEEHARDMEPCRPKKLDTKKSSSCLIKTATQAARAPRAGFTDLPPELRNKVYRNLFVSDNPIFLPGTREISRGGQFLSTCKMVHAEGCSVLYGENKFTFDRNHHTRGPFWEAVPKEIGYKDIRTFLKVIGPENLAFLRDIKLVLEDATRSSTPYIESHEERRYLNDEHLIDCLRTLRQARLRSVILSFHGRRAIMKTDVRFLGYLEQIKADDVTCQHNYFCPSSKVGYGVWDKLKESMVRKKKLYKE